jgi:peptidyl-prolyl cis-trans isomerase D
MSVIQRIRDKGAWIIFGIIALALIAFILQDGVRRGGRTFSNTSAIGKVNGEKIEKADFEEKLALQERMYAGQGAQRDQLIGSVWNQEVDRVVLNQEYDKLGLQVSSKELSEILFGENSPLRQEFTDPKTGQFMAENARQAFAQLKKSKNADQINMINNVYIKPAIQQALRVKYQNLLMQGAYVPKWLLEKQQADNNAIASISYLYVPYASVPDSSVKVTDDEIAAYVKKHSKEYIKTEETRNISYVSFSSAPTSADSANTLNQLLALKAEFKATNDVEAFFTKNPSDLPFYNSYFSKSRIQQANKDSLTSLPVGGVYGPYVDGSSYIMAKMVGVKQWPDSAKVRHILIGTVDGRSGQPIRPDSVAKKLADSIETAIKGGADFAALCAKYSDDPGSKDKAGVYEFFPQGQMVIPFNDFAFDKPVGSKAVVKTDFGYHYMEVLGQKNSGPAYKIAYLSRPIIASNETVNAASTAAAQFAVSAKSPKAFTENAAKANLQPMGSNDIKQNDFNLIGLGQNRQLVRWVYEHGLGDISEPIEVGDRYIVAMISAVNPAGLMTAAEARPTVEILVRNEKKAKQLIETRFKGNTLEALASSSGATVQRADSLSFTAPFISGIGSEPKVIGAAFNKSLAGKVSNPIEGATGVFAVRVESNGAKVAAVDPVSFRQSLIQGAKMATYRGLDALRKAADIKDYRAKFY